MSRKISDIYAEYKIIPSLQLHMLRVAAVASIICDNFNEPLPKDEIITACLLHDMGNIIKFKMDVMPEFFQPEGVEYWQSVKDEYITKYGNNEHEATVKIIKELNLPGYVALLADQNRFSLICEHRESDDMKIKIVHYADGRVTPHGVVSYEDRMNEAKKRYESHENSPRELERRRLVDCGLEIEKQIFAKCKIKPEDITDNEVMPLISTLRDFVLK
jgi:23S rRNA maturation-related 3'-5' exoribonuclease YhaM